MHFPFIQHSVLIIPNITVTDLEKIIEIKTNIFYNFLQNTKLNIAVLDIIKKFSKTNKIILATNSHKIKAEALLRHYTLSSIFDKKYYKESYTHLKGNKYQYVLKDLNIKPNNVILFEDNQDEIKKAIILNIPSENIINLPKGEKNYEEIYNLC